MKKGWKYTDFLEDAGDIEYAHLYCGKSLEEACPEHLKEEFEKARKKIEAFMRSFSEVGLTLDDASIFDTAPEKFVNEFYQVKNEISSHVLTNYEKPQNYDFLLDLTKMVEKIRNRSLCVQKENLKQVLHNPKVRNFYKSIDKISNYVDYDIFKTKTGRLSTKKGSFPILNLNKDFRKMLESSNGCYIELDFNAAELRTLLALSNKKQPDEDLHEWNAKNVYRGLQSREEAKKRIFAWLYNPDSKDYVSNRAYNRNAVLKEYYDGEYVTNPFGRRIKADDYHALNYLIQSSSNDIFLRQALKINKMLEDSKSHVAFLMHDSVVIDMDKDDRHLITELVDTFAETDFGKFLVNVKIGKNFGGMRAV